MVNTTNPSASDPETPAQQASVPYYDTKTLASASSPAPVRRTVRPRMVATVIVALFVVAIAVSRRPSQPVAAAAADAQPEDLVPLSDVAPVAQPLETTPAESSSAATIVAPRAVSKAPAKASVLKPEKSRITEADGPRAEVTAVAAALGTEDSTTQPAASESINAEPVSLDSVGPGAATITGCLETDGSRFRLTDTEGSDAPRSRSWRTGFLKKRSTAVALVEFPDPGTLHTQVGQRVAAMGVLTNREMHVTSVRPIGARCN